MRGPNDDEMQAGVTGGRRTVMRRESAVASIEPNGRRAAATARNRNFDGMTADLLA
jgi:hypothetical protein